MKKEIISIMLLVLVAGIFVVLENSQKDVATKDLSVAKVMEPKRIRDEQTQPIVPSPVLPTASTSQKIISPSATLSSTSEQETSSQKCVAGEKLITGPTSPEFIIEPKDQKSFCFKPIFGKPLVSPDGKWTAVMESDAKGPIFYDFKQGPSVYDKDSNVFILFTNLITGEQKEVSVVSVTPQKPIALIKSGYVGGQFSTASGITKWSSDGKNLWGAVSIYNAGLDINSLMYMSNFKIDVENWKPVSYLWKSDMLSDSVQTDVSALNVDKGIVWYTKLDPFQTGMGLSTLSLNTLDLASEATTTITSYKLMLNCVDEGIISSSLNCHEPDLKPQWVNSSTISWIDPTTGKTVVREGL
jgi:hypothetical protein